MSGTGFLRIGKLKNWPKLLAAARHNYRAIEAELRGDGHIDPARTHLNYRLLGPETPEGVVAQAHARLDAVGITKLRANVVLAIELIFSLPARSSIDDRKFFQDCVAWSAGEFGGPNNLFSADVHRDEGAPHCHILLLPLINGRMVGSDLVGGGPAFQARLTRFHEAVAHPYGLCRPPPKLRGAQQQVAASAVLNKLRELRDPALRSVGAALIVEAIKDDPRDWLSLLDVDVPEPTKKPKPMRSMTAIFTSPGKGPRREPASATL